MLREWGIWRRADRSLPPHASLRTAGGDVRSPSDSAEKTHKAVLYLRELSYPHFRVLDRLYERPDIAPGKVFEQLKEEMGWSGQYQLSKMRSYAEDKVASFRRALDQT